MAEMRDQICRIGFFGMGWAENKVAAQERAVEMEEFVGSDGMMVKARGNYWENTMGTFLCLLRDILREQWRKHVDDDIWLRFMKSGYALGSVSQSCIRIGREALCRAERRMRSQCNGFLKQWSLELGAF